MTVHRFPIIVYYEDTDMAGIVYYANYLRFIERARSTIVAEMGIDQLAMRANGIIFAISRVEASYRGAARLGDRLTVETTHRAQSAVRWMFEQNVVRDSDVIFSARVTAVSMTTEGKPVRLPPEVRALNNGGQAGFPAVLATAPVVRYGLDNKAE